jgi:predicted lipoprotein with Yx(FWY)xxD motif
MCALAACSSTASAPPSVATTAPATVTLLTAKGIPGTYLTNDSGRALYMWDADRSGSSTCYQDCAVAWPPLTVTDHAVAGPGVDAALIGSITRTDGSTQVTYGGWPLYYFASDAKAGDLTGQGNTGFGAVWWVISPSGHPLPSEPLGTAG